MTMIAPGGTSTKEEVRPPTVEIIPNSMERNIVLTNPG